MIEIYKWQLNCNSKKDVQAHVQQVKELLNQHKNGIPGAMKQALKYPKSIRDIAEGAEYSYIDTEKSAHEADQAKKEKQKAEKDAKQTRAKLLKKAKEGDEVAKDQLLSTAWNEAGFTIDMYLKAAAKKIMENKTDQDYLDKREVIRKKILAEIAQA